MTSVVTTLIPTNVLPGGYITATAVNTSQNVNGNVLLVGTATTNAATTPTLVTSASAAQTLYGANSSLANLVSSYIAIDQNSTVYSVPQPFANALGTSTALTSIGGLAVGYCVYMTYDSNAATSTVVDAFFNDSVGRWSYGQEEFGKAISCVYYQANAITSLISNGASTVNSKFITITAVPNSTSTSQEAATASIAAAIIVPQQANPGIGLVNTPLYNFSAPAVGDMPSRANQLALINAGLNPLKMNLGQVQLVDAVATYTTDNNGNRDYSWQSFAGLCELEFIVTDLRTFTESVTLNRKVVTDDTLVSPANGFISAGVLKQELAARCYFLADEGYLTNADATASGIQVQEVPGGRFNIYIPVTRVSANRVDAINLQFQNS